jgi:hypothetical protein
MPGLRVLLRIAPLVVGLVAVWVWLRRREAGRRALGAAAEVPQIGAPPMADAPSQGPPGRFQRKPIDIVTVVDDLLRGGR